ncbi:MAG TPA: SDR family NAD(P)-dependent oxidoreductase, partial [Pirellulales bacterium]|nr:SDR family NAD(P)-dependent oxidoreductase [Pirellulales bacterium]
DLVGWIAENGSEAIAVTCDVADREQVDQVASAAIRRFGRIDTWVNNAGQGMYGKLDEVSEEDSRRLFDINFWGVVNGSLAALPHLKSNGGALINIGSEVSEAYAPLLGIYTATKHAVKGYTDVLRVEIEDIAKAPVSIRLIQPTAVDTPFPQHARNYMSQEPKLPGPMIEPQQVAEAILEAAEHPIRDERVDTTAKINTTLATLFPGVADWMAAKQADRQHYNEAPRHANGALHQPSETIQITGHTRGSGGQA